MPPIREVLPGAFQVTLPLPFELSSVNVFLIHLREGWLLVDCGLDTEASFEALMDAFQDLSVPLGSIRQILVTHTHPDHVGQARRLLKLSGAQLILQRDEVEQLHKVASSGEKPLWLDAVLHEAGVPEHLVEKIEASFERIRRQFQMLEPDWVLTGGEVIQTALGALEVVCTPGHSPGHVCLFAADRRAMFTGDHILERITPNIGWLPGRDALGEYLDSLSKVEPFDLDFVIPSHGNPFPDHRAWIANTKRHHEDRCAQILAAAAQAPRTPHELVSDLWTRPLAPFHHRFAVFEVLAHVEFLARRGKLETIQTNGVKRWATI